MAARPPFTDAPRAEEMPEDEAVLDMNQGGVQIQRRGNRAVVDFNPGMTRASQDDSRDHSRNLVDELSSMERANLANDIVDWVETDIQSRKDWERRMENAMELLGIDNIPGDELPFDGASAVTHPMLGEAVVNFQARAIEEIFPSEGPVKTKIVGEFTREKEEQAERIKNHMNWQILDQDRSYFWEVDQMLFYLPIGGSAFKKTYYDDISEMIVSPFIKPDDFIVPYICSSLQTAPRYTHRMFKNETEMKKHFESGFYKEFELVPQQPGVANQMRSDWEDRSDDRDPEVHEKDSIWTLLECHCDLELEFDEGVSSAPLPYIATVERETRQLIGLRRNWKEDDPHHRKRLWFTHYKYLPGLGFYGFGLLHIIGSAAEATSGTLRALLDSAAFANMQGGYVSSDAKFKPGDEHIEPGVYKEVNMTSEELRNAFYTPPFREPSTALSQLFSHLLDSTKAFTSTTEVMTGEGANTGPVGTTVAMIEQASKPFSAIHRRLHMAAAEEFSLRAELNYEFLPNQYPYQVENEEGVVFREDYDGRVDIIPISDPNIFSSTQRIAQAQALVQRATERPDLYNAMEVEERFLRAIRIPDYDDVLQKNDPKRLDPVSENMKLLQGQGAKAFLEQDHDAHIDVHLKFIEGLNMNEQAMEQVGPLMQAHLAEHYAMKYFVELQRQLGGQLPPPGQFEQEGQEMSPEMDAMIAQAVAQLPVIEIIDPADDMDEAEESFQAEERRKEEAFIREQERKDQEVMAEQERKDLEAVAKDNREDMLAQLKARREDRAAKAELERKERLAKAEAQRKAERKPAKD